MFNDDLYLTGKPNLDVIQVTVLLECIVILRVDFLI